MEQKMMKAMAFKEFKKVELKEVPIPKSDGTSAVIRVKACGVCGSDTEMRWTWGWGEHCEGIFGHEFCGEVVDPGSNKDLKPGDRVTAMTLDPCGECKYCLSGREDMCAHVVDRVPGVMYPGAFAEYVEVKRSDMLRKVPDDMTDVEAALAEPLAVAFHACTRGDVEPGRTVLVCGSGTIGMFSAAVAKYLGAEKVVITGANPERRKLAQAAPFIDDVIDTHDDTYHDLMNEKYPDGFDTILECSGLRKVQEGALQHLAIGGTFTIIGFLDQELTVPTLQIYMKQQRIQGCEMETRQDFENAMEFLHSKKQDLVQYTNTAPLEDLQACYEDLASGKTPVLKYIMIP